MWSVIAAGLHPRGVGAVSVLTLEQFTRDLGGSFCSVRDTLVHRIGGEWGWLQVATMLRQVGAEPLQRDFRVFLLEASGRAAVAE